MLIYFLVFTSGLAITVMEITLARFVQPFLGNSTIIWAHIISVTMLALSIGYFLGGWLAKHIHKNTALESIIPALMGISGLTIAFSYVLSKVFFLPQLLKAIETQNISIVYILFIVVLIIFSSSLVVLACITPVAIQYLSQTKKTGEVAGTVYFLTTVGGIVGIFLPAIILIPLLGSSFTIVILASLLGFSWVYYHRFYVLIGTALLSLFIFPLSNKVTAGVIFEQESTYNYLQVIQKNERNFLRINEGQAEHSVYDPKNVLVGGVWDYFSALPAYLPEFKRTAIVGLAGGTISHALSYYYPNNATDGIEIDPAIIDLGKKYFTLSDPQLIIHNADGRIFLLQTKDTYDLICLDAYKQPYIPYNLATKEFFALVKDRLNPAGIMAMNIGTAGESDLLASLEYTVKQVFPHTRIVHIPGSFNYLLIASLEPLKIQTTIPEDVSKLLPIMEQGVNLPNNLRRVVFTDDHAPIEFFTDRMIWKTITQVQSAER
ncbi:MAG: hypothetical protein A2V81_01485 [Candidatus Abawacabacteria bacterium RBG_16_42_10]|uniref:PABS domain-containing protein n=1 Tax=Candidatus Abawacabacteria bacterium RBG_16_42_10 TaxID=1817814 RepID=A0A1F4XKN7_9BACT|nr:MAG: hypothetical protein A2V81_01485 [Candidatus Abawacabacteria bacterium RBG_16_42_10]